MKLRLPFVLGVTGKMAFPGYSPAPRAVGVRPTSVPELQVYETVWSILEWLRSESGALDPSIRKLCEHATCAARPKAGEYELHWCGLSLRHTPIIVLTSLAPGVDTIAAEAALDYADSYRARGIEVDVFVRAPLPFPLEDSEGAVYRHATTFHRGCTDEHGEADCPRLARFDALVERLRKQPGFEEKRDLFCVELDDDLEDESSPEARDRRRREDLTTNWIGTKGPRHLRYRGAGEYIAVHSHLLLAVCAPSELDKPEPTGIAGSTTDESRFECGTPTVVQAKRRGATYELLSLSNSVTWADNGPVLHAPLAEQTAERSTEPLRLLHPFDLEPRPKADIPRAMKLRLALGLYLREKEADIGHVESDVRDENLDAIVQRRGDRIFRHIVKNLEEFNRIDETWSAGKRAEAEKREHEALDDLLKPSGADFDILRNEGERRAKSEAWRQARGSIDSLSDLAASRRRASTSAGDLDSARDQLVRRLTRLILIAALAFSAFGNWSPPDGSAQVGSNPSWILQGSRVLLLLVALGAAWFAARHLAAYRRAGIEARRYDHRALSEGLRVQFYMCAAGVHASVASDYLQRHRGEVLWIRHAISSASIPLARWRHSFERLKHAERCELLRAVHQSWVKGQIEYTRKRALPNVERARSWGHLGWGLAGGAILNAAAQLLALIRRVESWVDANYLPIAAVVAAIGLALITFHVIRGRHEPLGHVAEEEEMSDARGLVRWLIARPLRLGYAFVSGALAFLAAHGFGDLAESAGVAADWPSKSAWWITWTSALLICGGMGLAWSDRRSHVQHARSNAALLGLYESADRRLGPLLDRYRDCVPDSNAAKRTLEEIQTTFYELGREALSENAEWLILHRTRPLEAFLA